MDVLCLMQIDANMLRSKLALPQEKVVMLVMEVIGVMGLTGFRKVLWEISRTHCKQAVKEVAAEIAHELHELVGS